MTKTLIEQLIIFISIEALNCLGAICAWRHDV